MTVLDSKHESVIEALTQSVRVLCFDQVSKLIDVGYDDGREVVNTLESSELVSVETHFVSALGEATHPVLSWMRDEKEPDFGRAAYEFRNRWNEPVEMDLILPTANACKLFGGTRVRPRDSEWVHDLWMSSVFLHYKKLQIASQELAWVSGDTLRSDGNSVFGGKVPDACLKTLGGAVVKIVEGGGRGYNKSKLSGLHSSYSTHAAYEIW